MTERLHLLVGTRKGAFHLTSRDRQHWELAEPILPGWSVYHAAFDMRDGKPRAYLAANHWAWGPSVAKSDDGAVNWDFRSEGLAFSPETRSPAPEIPGAPGEWSQAPPGVIGNIWYVAPGHPSEPGVLYAGGQPAGLFRSLDWGRTWQPLDGLNRHPYRKYWSGTGGGDSCVHSVIVDPRDPRRLYAAVSAGGAYRSDDGGVTWELIAHNAVATHPEALRLIREFIVEGAPAGIDRGPWDKDPAGLNEFHALRLDPTNPDRLWGQAHWGVFRSDDCGTTWTDVTAGLPSFHGFGLTVSRAGSVFVVPLDYGADNFRVCPGQLAVYRTADGGRSWERLTRGLPGPNDYQSVYREGLVCDGLELEGTYVGTSNGELYATFDGGELWRRLPGTLPPILAVAAAAW